MRKNSGAEGNGIGVKRKAYAGNSNVTWGLAGKWNHRQGVIKPSAAVGSKLVRPQSAEAGTRAALTLRQHNVSQSQRDRRQSH